MPTSMRHTLPSQPEVIPCCCTVWPTTMRAAPRRSRACPSRAQASASSLAYTRVHTTPSLPSTVSAIDAGEPSPASQLRTSALRRSRSETPAGTCCGSTPPCTNTLGPTFTTVLRWASTRA